MCVHSSANVKALVPWAIARRSTNRPPKLSLTRAQILKNSGCHKAVEHGHAADGSWHYFKNQQRRPSCTSTQGEVFHGSPFWKNITSRAYELFTLYYIQYIYTIIKVPILKSSSILERNILAIAAAAAALLGDDTNWCPSDSGTRTRTLRHGGRNGTTLPVLPGDHAARRWLMAPELFR